MASAYDEIIAERRAEREREAEAARKQLVPGAHIDGAIRDLVHTRITELIDVFDDQIGSLIVGEFDGTYAEWERHLADKLVDTLFGAI